MAKTTPLSPCAIRTLIAKGQLIVISDNRVLRLDGWAARHPGGRLPILHMVGKDATDQILRCVQVSALNCKNSIANKVPPLVITLPKP